MFYKYNVVKSCFYFHIDLENICSRKNIMLKCQCKIEEQILLKRNKIQNEKKLKCINVNLRFDCLLIIVGKIFLFKYCNY